MCALFGTNCTSEFLLWVIWRACHASAVGFHAQEQNQGFCQHIQTCMVLRSGWTFLACSWYQVARVFQSPGGWAPVFSWDHENYCPCWCMADSTSSIVVMNSWKWTTVGFILCPMHLTEPHSKDCLAYRGTQQKRMYIIPRVCSL